MEKARQKALKKKVRDQKKRARISALITQVKELYTISSSTWVVSADIRAHFF